MSTKVSGEKAKVEVYAEKNWNGTSRIKGQVYDNHESGRSLSTVVGIVQDWATWIAKLASGSSVKVVKGIHKDSKRIDHVTVKVDGEDRLRHIVLDKTDFKDDGTGNKTFVWVPKT